MRYSCHGRRRAQIVAALIGACLAPAALGQVDGTWTGLAGTSWWTDAANWTSDPQFPSGGGWATLPLGAPVTVDQSIALRGITFDHLPGKIFSSAGSITLTGPAELRTLASGAVTVAEQRWREHSIAAFVTGPAGLTKTGAATLRLTTSSGHTGGTRLNGGMLIVRDDGGLGAAGHGLSFDGGTLRFDSASFSELTVARPVALGAGGGTIDLGTYYRIFMSNPVAGNGDLTVVANQGIAVLTTPSTHTGRTEIYGGGTAGFSGRVPSSSSIHAAGYFSFGSDGIGDSTPVSLRRAHLHFGSVISTEPVEERTGTITLAGGNNLIELSTGTMTSARLVTPALVREARSTLSIRGRSLGQPLGTGVTQFQFDNGTSLLVGGGGPAGSTTVSIIPFINDFTDSASAFVTYAANGVRPLSSSEYAAALPAGVSQQNVRLAQAATVNAPVTINALALGSVSLVNLSGSATLTVSSGAIRGAGTISCPIDFGAAEGVLNGPRVVNHALTITGPISGTGGLTVGDAGFSGIMLSGASTYTGQTTLNEGTIRLGGNVVAGVPGPLGADTSPIVIGNGRGGSALLGTGSTTVTIARDLIVLGDRRESYPPRLGVNVSGHIDLRGPLILENNAVLSGQISGPGRMVAEFSFTSASGGRLTGNNTYSGGTELNGASIGFSGSTAFGTGPIVVLRDANAPRGSTLNQLGSATTLSNPIILHYNLEVISSGSLNLASSLDLTSGQRSLFTFAPEMLVSGQIHSGTFLTVTSGTGVMRLTGNDNRQWGNIIDPGTVRVEADNALGRNPAKTDVFGTLELVSDVSIPAHPLELRSGGVLRNLSGSNRWNGNLSTGTNSTINVVAGHLRIAGDLSAGSTGTITKSGPGVLELKNIRGTATLNVSAGEVRITPDGTNAGACMVRHLALAGSPTAPTSRFDLTNNAMIIQYFNGQSPIVNVRSLLRAAYTSPGGAWTGNGLTTSMGNEAHFGIGVAEQSALTPPPTTFFGQQVNGLSLLLRFTRYGDANLDGVVNLQDFNRLAANFGQSGRFWHHGDFNYDGVVNLQDFNRLAANFGLSAAGPSVTPEDWAALASAVPEPGLTVAPLIGLMCLKRRRRSVRG